MSKAKSSAVAPSRLDDAASVTAVLTYGPPRTDLELATEMHWDIRRVDRAIGVLRDNRAVTQDVTTYRYSLVHDGNLST